MQPKSPRGVQQEEVSAAADALLAEKQRPTIERVRMKMGRGSPNTVGPMLEVWFASLGARLGGEAPPQEDDHLPPAVRKAALVLWQRAERVAQVRTGESIAAVEASLADARQALEADAAVLVAREEVLVRREADLQQALDLAKTQLAEQAERVKTLGATLALRDADLEGVRAQAATLVHEIDAERRRRQEESQAHAEDRRRQDERSAANERRLLEEVDRARQEAKQARGLAVAAEGKLEAARARLRESQDAAHDAARRAELEVATTRQAAAAAEIRAAELLGLLEQERTACTEILQRLADRASADRRVDGVVSSTVGAWHRQELFESDDLVDAARAAELMGVGKEVLSRRRKSGVVLALENDAGKLRYPAWQFEKPVLPHMKGMLSALNGRDPWSNYLFFVTTQAPLGGCSPLDLLRSGEVERVLELVGDTVGPEAMGTLFAPKPT